MQIQRFLKHSLGALAEGTLIAAMAVALLAGTAFAGKPTGGGGTVNLVVLDGGDAIANHGERVTFQVSTTATDRPFVGVRCYQGDTWIYDAYIGFFATYMYDQWTVLDSQPWDGARAAECTARLFYYDKRGNQKVLATTAFTAHP